jgi:sulfate permease, SulP family
MAEAIEIDPSNAPLASARTLRTDLIAGATLALVGIPQCVAYAMMSGLPPAYGLSTAVVAGAIAALIGRSAQVATGPTNTTGLLVAAALAPWLDARGVLRADAFAMLAALTLLAGFVRLIGAVAGAAKLLRFIPGSVLVGFLTGAGLLIAVMQLDEALGLDGVRGAGLIAEVSGIARQLEAGQLPRWPAIVVFALSIAAVAIGQRIDRRFPMSLAVIVAFGFAAWGLGLDARSGLPLLSDRGPLPSGWPALALPSVAPGVLLHFAAPSIAIALLGTLELSASAGASGRRSQMTREIAAQGCANAIGAFAGAMPASASLARSSVLRLSGARTRIAALSAAFLTIPALLFGAPLLGFIPQASVAGVLAMIAFGMIDRPRIRVLWKSGIETRSMLVATFVAALVLPLEQAILIGVGLGLAMHVTKATTPRVTALAPMGDRLQPLVGKDATEIAVTEIAVIEVSGALHYAAVESFAREARAKIPPGAKLVLIDLSHAHQARIAALTAIDELRAELAKRGTGLALAGVSPELAQMARNVGIEIDITPAEQEPGLSVRRALERIRAR